MLQLMQTGYTRTLGETSAGVYHRASFLKTTYKDPGGCSADPLYEYFMMILGAAAADPLHPFVLCKMMLVTPTCGLLVHAALGQHAKD